MQINYPTDVLNHGLRVLALILALIVGLELSQPILARAQPNGTGDSAAVSNELPPIQETETVEVRSPFYKRWWFWTIAAVLVGGAAIAMSGGGGGGGSAPPSGPSGTVTVNGPAPR